MKKRKITYKKRKNRFPEELGEAVFSFVCHRFAGQENGL